MMNKNYLLIAVMVLALFAGLWLQGIVSTAGNTNKFRHTQATSTRLFDSSGRTIEFAWDIHDVLVEKKVARMAIKALTHATAPTINVLGRATKESLWALMTGHDNPALAFAKKIAHLALHQGASEEFKHVLNEYDPAFWPAIVSILTEQYPINGMQEILESLSAAGYTSRVASNISEEEFTILAKRHPELFSHLQDGVMTHFNGDTIIKKPDPLFFERFIKTYGASNKQFVFIDDLPQNIAAAQQAGMIGILFIDREQLISDLAQLGIELPLNQAIA